MPLRPKPSTFTCPACGWRKTTAPRSDAVLPGLDWFVSCPKCGNEDLAVRKANVLEAIGVKLRNQIGRP